ncbi:ankyrin repeat domain-containing protein [Xanthomarina sp. F2636L]|uniref:ankyrin repeat domain-containing protein n=1 Tax=Xanthomarina sp. F2636L TaxID=2996018 RepID=UPI00225E5A83|nr:ankyrin repeat domain-containing protein [Xanthomarina sp. F2636L]MCX7551174.1 ankyrin repeat domain-containing protein [Xanthomarina sp. F2636L]
MTYFKQVTLVFIFIFGVQLIAQENIFLEREFWSSNPSIETIDQNIKKGHDISQANSNNFDAVVLAILQDVSYDTLEYIQSKPGNDVNKLTHDGRTYIFWAAYKGNVPFMEYLLKKGAKTDVTDDKGNTILNFAAGSGQQNTQVYDLCLAHGANLEKDLTPNGANALLLAAPFDTDFVLIDYFTSKGLSINSVDSEGNGVFNYVAKTGNIDLLNKLLERNIKGNDQAFVFAAYGTRGKTNGIEAYKFLESTGLNPNTRTKEGISPLQIVAARNKDVSITNYFIEKGADINLADKNGNTALIHAASRNNLEVISTLLKGTKDINWVNNKGQSALSLAIANNSAKVVSFLMEHKANVEVLDTNGNHLAYYLLDAFPSDDFQEKVKLLKTQGFDISKVQEDGNTLYHLAVSKNNLELVKWVSQYKVDINAKNKEGNTALHLAAMSATDMEILKYLIEQGAKKKELTEFEETAFDLASENEILLAKKLNFDFLSS